VLEILVLWKLASSLAEKCKAKGHPATGYVCMLIALWIVGEILGFIAGVALNLTTGSAGGEPPVLLFVLFGYGGAAIGACIAFVIVGSLSDQRRRLEYDGGRYMSGGGKGWEDPYRRYGVNRDGETDDRIRR
jgi:hypothetical protein